MKTKAKRELVLDSKIWFTVLWHAIEVYLCGMGDNVNERYFSCNLRDDVEAWIFGQQDYQFCFNEVWSMFFDQDPEMIKKEMEKRLEYKYKKHFEGSEDAEAKSLDRRKKKTVFGDCTKFGRNSENCWRDEWVESVLFT